MNVKTNIGKKFLSLVRKHFPKGSPLYSIFNEKKLKMSYSTMPNMAQHIASHNKKEIKMAKGREDPQSFVKITLLDQADTLEETVRLELIWTRKLFAFRPTGLNVREEDNS